MTKLQNFKNAKVNAVYGFDGQNVVKRATGAVVKFEGNRVRLNIDGKRTWFKREALEVVQNKERATRKTTKMAVYRNEMAKRVMAGESKEQVYADMIQYCKDTGLIAKHRDVWVYFARSWERVSSEPSKFVL